MSFTLPSKMLMAMALYSLCFLALSSAKQLSENAKTSALFAFGDSILDTGNNNDLFTLTKCNFAPYGRDFLDGRATGRFGNGRVFSDMIAEGLGLKNLLPAYRDPFLSNDDLPTGVCFASGGSGLDAITARIQGVIWVPDQVNDFNEYITKLNNVVGNQEETNAIISNAVYLISAGNNDLAITYYSTKNRVFQYTVSAYTDLMITWTHDLIKSLYDLGARKFAVLGTLPLGCVPAARHTPGNLFLNFCLSDVNQGAYMFNQKLSAEIDNFSNNFSGAKFTYVDMYNPLLDLIKDPSSSGFTDVIDGCCCMVTSPIPCPDASSYVFWDFAHPTEKSYQIITSKIIEQMEENLT